MKQMGLLFFGLFLSSVAQAACVTIDISDWEQSRKNHLAAHAYSAIFESGQNIVPRVDHNTGEVCADGYVGNLSAVLTKSNQAQRYDTAKTARETAALAERNKRTSDIAALKAKLRVTDDEWQLLTGGRLD